MRILLVEDDPQLGDGLTVGLRQDGYAVDWVKDGVAADLALKTEHYDLVVLDLGLPRLDGMSLLRQLRGRGDSLPVLILTARDALGEKISGLDQGADEYLVKPVRLEELSARIRALLRRAAGRALPVLQVGSLSLDPATHEVRQDGRLVECTQKEFVLLQLLMENAGRVLSRAQIDGALYGWRDEPDSNAVEVHVHNLRKKLGSEAIKTLRGIGYSLPRPA